MYSRVVVVRQVVLCFSPVGATLRVRARKFPSIVNCTAIDWFHAWPQEALRSVSKRFIAEVESLPVTEPIHVAKFLTLLFVLLFDDGRRNILILIKKISKEIAQDL